MRFITPALWILGALISTPSSASQMHIADGSQPFNVQGRTSIDASSGSVVHVHQWPGIYFEGHFTGASVTAKMNDTVNRFAFYIDGKKIDAVRDTATGSLSVSGLSSGEHSVRLEKLSESQNTTGAFIGFFAGTQDHKVGHWPERARQIEFVGDSYTVGYGNMSGKKQCTPDELHDTTDTSQAYGPLTAKQFNADYQINAFSGRGIVRNYDGFIGDPLPALHPFVLFDKKEVFSDPRWKPQVIVIGLGGNDFSTPVKPGEKWKDEAALKADYEQSFVTLVKALRAKNPQAFFLLTKYEGPTVAEEVEKVATQLKASGETRLDTIGLDGFTLNGCDWHLDSNDHKRISEQLTGYLKAHPELWQGK
jgi:lysophospholipase L1-like esterase